MTRPGRLASLAVAGLIVAAIIALAWGLRQGAGNPLRPDASESDSADVVQQYAPQERQPVQDFSAQLLDGTTLKRADLIGTVSVVNVWGSWCGPCRSEAPHLVRVARQLSDQAQFLGINVRDNRASARAFERSFDIPYPSVQPDDAGTVILAFGGALTAAAIPSTVVLDESGRVAARVVGPVDASTLRGLVLDLLREA